MSEVLPVDRALPELRGALRGRRIVILTAPPGAGKSTRVPLELLSEPWLAGQRISMLEPRRLAARQEYRLRELLAHKDAYEIVTFEDEKRAPKGFATLAPAW